jgi:hypothetical protein
MLAVVLLLLILGCNNSPTSSNSHICDFTLPTLDPLLEEQIIQDFLAYWFDRYGTDLLKQYGWDSLTRLNYYGTHNDYVAFLWGGMNTIVINIKVAGTIFFHSNEDYIYLWKDGTFYEMVDAYLEGLLSTEDIRKIGEIHKKKLFGCLCLVPDWYYDEEGLTTIIP